MRWRAAKCRAPNSHHSWWTVESLAEGALGYFCFVAKYEGGERRIDVAEFVAIVRAIGADPVKLLRDLISGKMPAKPRRGTSK